jgi:hypothetical protein
VSFQASVELGRVSNKQPKRSKKKDEARRDSERQRERVWWWLKARRRREYLVFNNMGQCIPCFRKWKVTKSCVSATTSAHSAHKQHDRPPRPTKPVSSSPLHDLRISHASAVPRKLAVTRSYLSKNRRIRALHIVSQCFVDMPPSPIKPKPPQILVPRGDLDTSTRRVQQ